MTNYGQNCTDGIMRQSPSLLLSNYSWKRESSQKRGHSVKSWWNVSWVLSLHYDNKRSKDDMQGVKGENFENRSQKVFLSQTLTASYFVQDIRTTLSATWPWKGEADENLPKWSWSPLSRSSSWSWSRSSVSCDVGVHQPNCRGSCRTFDSWAKGSLLLFWEVVLQLLCFNPIRSGFPKRRNKTQFEKGKKETQPPAKFDGKESPLTVRQKR